MVFLQHVAMQFKYNIYDRRYLLIRKTSSFAITINLLYSVLRQYQRRMYLLQMHLQTIYAYIYIYRGHIFYFTSECNRFVCCCLIYVLVELLLTTFHELRRWDIANGFAYVPFLRLETTTGRHPTGVCGGAINRNRTD